MRKINCFVIDDEAPARELLKYYIERDERLSFVGSYHNVSNFDYEELSIDLLFLDIEMPGVNGVEFLENNAPKFKTIFTTASGEYAIQGFELGVKDYLLKPILRDRFTLTIDKIVASFLITEKSERFDSLLNQQESLSLKSGNKKVKVSPARIKYITAQNEYISIVTDDNRHTVYMRMKELEENPSFDHMLRVHRSHFVNPQFVDEWSSESVRIDKESIPIGRSFKRDVKEAFSTKK